MPSVAPRRIHLARISQMGRSFRKREKGSSLNRAFLTPKPLTPSVYVHILEAPSPLRRSISVTSRFPSTGSDDSFITAFGSLAQPSTTAYSFGVPCNSLPRWSMTTLVCGNSRISGSKPREGEKRHH